MPLRDVFIITFILGSIPLCFLRPYYGALMWAMVSFLSPHRLAWSTARYYFEPALMVASATLLGYALSSEPKRLPRSGGTYLLIAIWLCLGAATLGAWSPVDANAAWLERTKILLMAFVTLSMMTTRDRLFQMCMVVAGSLGLYGVKGGVFAIATGLQHKLYGPPRTFIADNNAMAMALNMVLPLLFYLTREVEHRTVRLLLRVTFAFCIIGVVITYSRGGLLGLVTVMFLLLVKSKRKITGAFLLAVATFGLLTYAPGAWTDRMSTIETYDQDASAFSRINAWRLAWRMALARPAFGFGPQAMEDKSFYTRYYPDSPSRNDSHSAYFQLLAEGGFLSFGVFIWSLVWCLWITARLGRRFRDDPANRWVANYADMLQVSICAYMVSAAFLELAFFDLIYHIMAMCIVTQTLARPLVAQAVVRPARVAPSLWGATPLPTSPQA